MLTLSTECRLIFPIRLGKYDTSIGVTVASFLSAKKRLQNTVLEYSRLRRGFSIRQYTVDDYVLCTDVIN